MYYRRHYWEASWWPWGCHNCVEKKTSAIERKNGGKASPMLYMCTVYKCASEKFPTCNLNDSSSVEEP